jgi:hypothetical protein
MVPVISPTGIECSLIEAIFNQGNVNFCSGSQELRP